MSDRFTEGARPKDQENFPEYCFFFCLRGSVKDKSLWVDAKHWCSEQFGERGTGEVWQTNWVGTIMFKDPNHALAFKLRWC